MTVENIGIDVKTNAGDAARQVRSLSTALSGVRNAGKSVASGGTQNAVSRIGGAAKTATKHTGNLLASIKRIAMYRLLRTALKEVGKAFNEGLKNAYNFSKGIGGTLAEAMDSLATKSLTMKNQLGAAFGNLLTAITPILLQIINLVRMVAQAISALFSALGGGDYLVATDVAQSWDKATGAAKKYKNTILGFDEINRLDEPSGGGGGSSVDASGMFKVGELPDWAQKIRSFLDGIKLEDFKIKLKFNAEDILFNWKNLSGEQIAKKVITGLAALCGAAIGFMIGGVPGAIVGTLIGASLGVIFSSLIFDSDGVISDDEIIKMVCLAAGALAGGAVGFIVGGPLGALVGVVVGAGLSVTLSSLIFGEESEKKNEVLKTLIVAMSAIAGGVIGFLVGGPLGAVIGVAVGAGVSLEIVNAAFSGQGNKKEMLTKTIVATLITLAGGAIGFIVGGPLGALIGVAIGAGVSILINNALFNNNGKTLKENILKSLTVVLGALVGGAIGFVVGGPLGAVIGATIGIGVTLVADNVAWSKGSAEAIKAMGTTVNTSGFSSYSGKFASGGSIENNGSLFIAGEAGPEIVANMGSRTGVMNVDQMEAAVANGNIGVINAVYAMANAIVTAVNSIDTDITLDGESVAEKLYRPMQNASSRHGVAMVT